MIPTNTFECIVKPVADTASTAMQCTGEIVTAVSGWDVFTTLANWGILFVAAIALFVSEKSRRDSRKAMKASLDASNVAMRAQLTSSQESREASDKATKIQLASSKESLAASERAIETQINLSREALDATYNATQAQLDASREATKADLDERRNARELETTVELVAAIDELKLVASRDINEDDRGIALRRATMALYLAAGRYQLTVGDSKEIAGLQEQFLRLIQDFSPTSMAAFEGREHQRIHLVQGALRTSIIEYQRDKTLAEYYAHLRSALKNRHLEVADQLLGIEPETKHFPNTVP